MKNTEHVHEWYMCANLAGEIYAMCRDIRCHGKVLKRDEIESRINATERLKAGIDELMDACKDDPSEMGGPFVSLSWVADILEGK